MSTILENHEPDLEFDEVVDDSEAADPGLPRLAFQAVLAAMFVGLLIAFPLVVRSVDGAILGLLGLFLFLVVSLPVFLWRDYDVFEPLSLVVLMTVIGCSFKLFYVLAFAGSREYVDLILLNGGSISELTYGTAVVAAGMASFMAGYWRRQWRVSFRVFPLSRYGDWHRGRLLAISMLLVLVSGCFFVRLGQSLGVNLASPEQFSQKRFIDFNDQSGRDFREETLQSADYYYYRIAALAKFAFFLNLAWLVHQGRSLFSLHGMVVAVSGILTIAVFMFMNSRASVGLVLLDAVIISYYLAERIPVWQVMLGGAALGTLALVQLAMRAQEQQSVLQLVEKTVAGRDLMDISKMAITIGAIPDRLEYCHGETLLGWLAAPIPKKVWPQKPLWGERGVYVNQKVYGTRDSFSGITLGLPTELYWNFGWIGVMAGMYVAGTGLRTLYTAFLPFRGNLSAVVIYVLALTRLTIFTLGGDVGTGVLKTALDLLPMGVLILLLGYPGAPPEQE